VRAAALEQGNEGAILHSPIWEAAGERGPRDWQSCDQGGRVRSRQHAERASSLSDASNSSEDAFDVFLSHAHMDAEWVEQLAVRLEDDMGFHVWLDKWVLVPGGLWEQEMARGLDQASCCAVIVGASTPEGWFLQETQRALNRQAHDPDFRVIPVLAPGSDPSNLPPFTELRSWADFRNSDKQDYAFHVLAQGIKGLPVGRGPKTVGKKSAIQVKLIELEEELSPHLEREVVLEAQRELVQRWLRDV